METSRIVLLLDHRFLLPFICELESLVGDVFGFGLPSVRLFKMGLVRCRLVVS